MSDPTFHEEDFKRQLDWGLWRRVLRHVAPYRRPLTELGVLGGLVALCDVSVPFLTGRIIDEAMAAGLTRRLMIDASLYLAATVFICVCIWRFIELAGVSATGMGYDIRTKCFAKLQQLSFSYFDRRPVGWLMARLTSDCARLSNLAGWLILDVVWGTCLVAGIAAIMLWLNWPLALLVLALIPLLAWVTAVFQGRLLLSSRAMRKSNSLITASFNESITGVRTTKTLVREAENLREFSDLSAAMYRHSLRNSLQSALYLPLVLSISSLGVGLALWKGGADVASGVGGMSLGTLIAFMQYAALLYQPIEEMARRFTDLQVAQASAERIQGLLDEPLEIDDSPEVCSAIERETARPNRDPLAPEDGGDAAIRTIEFRNVSFSYSPGSAVLRGFNLTVRAGQTIALVGSTGGGKSTIVSLLCRFYEPTGGEILINGMDYRRRSLRWWQSNLGIVLQAPHLFSGSIRENIRYGKLDADDAQVEAAARLVNAHSFIMSMERGYGAEAGEGGNRLSIGQKQLIALARAVLADPPIFIMDEATSSVDTQTEHLIQDAITRTLKGRTSFVIAHRLSTIRGADRILVIDGGRIVEEGTHRDLLRLGGRYHALYTSQFTRDQEELILQGDRTS
jgi:ATP-binding cassette subfamily B protein